MCEAVRLPAKGVVRDDELAGRSDDEPTASSRAGASLATQSLVVFAIRTRRSPFLRSRPSRPLLATRLAVVAVGIALPFSPITDVLGFRSLPWLFLGILAAMTATYVALVEVAKAWFYAHADAGSTTASRGGS